MIPAEAAEPDGGVDERPAEVVLTAASSTPFTILPDWVALSGVSPGAQAVYWQLTLHVNHGRGDRVVFPSRADLAARLGYRQARSVDRYIAELVEVGAIAKRTERFVGGMRARNLYVLRMEPQASYRGPRSLSDLRLVERTAAHCTSEQTDETPDHPVVRSSALPEGADTHYPGAPLRTPAVQRRAPRLGTGTHRNQIKENQTKENHHRAPRPSAPAGPPDAEAAPSSGTRHREPDANQPVGEVEVEAQNLLRTLPQPWKLSEGAVQQMIPLVVQGLTTGWSPKGLRDELVRDLQGARNPSAVMISRLRRLPPPPPPRPGPSRSTPPPPCLLHPGAARRTDGVCAGCWADRQDES